MVSRSTPQWAERDVRNKRFVFFGGSTGIGRAAAIELARRGAAILIVGRGQAAGDAVVATLRQEGASSADFLTGDLATVAGIKRVAGEVVAWAPQLHGVMHTAMSAFHVKLVTSDGFEFAFALQYFARAALNRLLLDNLVASGDGRIVHIAGDVPGFIRADLDDLQFERRKWGFYKAVLGTHVLGFLHIQEAARRFREKQLPVSISASCVGPTKTKAMADKAMPLSMRLMGLLGTSPEKSAQNAVRLLVQNNSLGTSGCILRNPKKFEPKHLALEAQQALRLWDITASLASSRLVNFQPIESIR
ncbi:SDR family NAD(P)-dependent oxidoreductase [Pseudomonas sp. NBRC 100443]|uniref:SDR family NAD(P)-dependent oxidoreductase n=1 Tax=Pseudomonas sp. NBRC 100443 TaxID=1113665 RepID=UPI0024A60093|nr:SDR family NAD(P)-dependent oxidoreductase [Pseudomonas sp. NBRC 100443]GLU37383.1 short-chain dehydrogenase [Pseudomonas sp. NBRC 100443]